MRHSLSRNIAALLIAATVSACSAGVFGGQKASTPPEAERLPLNPGPIVPILEMMSNLPQRDPASQAETFQSVKDAAELTPTTSNRLRYALALATPGHAGADPVAAQRQLSQLLARPETLLPAERWLALIEFREVEQFLYREARYADESDYDLWESLWTDDALYWVPSGGADTDPVREMSVIYDNRNRISTRLKQLRTGRRYAQAPPSNLRRLLSNIEFLGGRSNPAGGADLEVGANFVVVESRARGNHIWGGRVTYRLRRADDGALRMAYKKVVLVDNDKPLPTLGFLI